MNRFFDRLPSELYGAIKTLVEEGWRQPALERRLRQAYLLQPLSIAGLVATQVERVPVVVRGPDGHATRRRLVQGNVPYQGSKLLWYTPPDPKFRFPIRGKVGVKSAKLCGLIDGTDVADFEALVTGELNRLIAALDASQPAVASYNDRIQAEIERQMSTF